MKLFPHVAARVFDTPLLVAPAPMRAFLHALGPRLGFEAEAPPAAVPALYSEDEDRAPWKGYQRHPGGVALIPIYGALVHRALSLEDICAGVTAYVDISTAYRNAQSDASIRAIVFDDSTPGGEGTGCFDLADEIYNGRGTKPIVAVVNDMALSAGYLLASAADRVVITQSGYVGSIGVVWSHLDMSEAEKQIGLAVTYLYAGARKIDGNPDNPLSDPARKEFQAKVDGLYELFCGVVARNRGMTIEAVKATEAAVFAAAGGDPVGVGLADEIGTLQGVLEQLAETSRLPATQSGTYRAGSAQAQETGMTTKSGAAGGPATEMTEAEMQAEAARVVAAAKAEATTAAITSERTRIKSIMTHAEAAGRTEMASHLAFDTDMTAEAATALLAKAPKAAAVAAAGFDAKMSGLNNPEVGPDTGKTGAAAEDAEAAQLAAGVVAFAPRPAKAKTG